MVEEEAAGTGAWREGRTWASAEEKETRGAPTSENKEGPPRSQAMDRLPECEGLVTEEEGERRGSK